MADARTLELCPHSFEISNLRVAKRRSARNDIMYAVECEMSHLVDHNRATKVQAMTWR